MLIINDVHPYPRKAYKITKVDGAQGTRYIKYGMMVMPTIIMVECGNFELINGGSTNNKHESVHFRCVNGRWK